MADLTEHEALERSAVAASAIFDPSSRGQFAVVPEGYRVEDLEGWQDRPNRIAVNHCFVDVDSLLAYLREFARPETMVSADYGKAVIAAVIDGHAPGVAAWGAHKARFAAQQSDVLKAWLKISGRGLSQVEFGLFLEDRAVDVVHPEAASVMDMVMTFDATKKVVFKSSQRLHDGQRQFTYSEENEARGNVTLPDHFIILAPVYRGMEPQRIKFMVRYRIEEGKLRFQVDMHDADRVLREAFDRCVDVLRTDPCCEGRHIFVVG